MKSNDETAVTTMKATRSTYIALSAIYFVLAAAFVVIGLTKGWMPGDAGVVLLMLGIGSGWIIWIHGFTVQITANEIRYRDGFYRWRSMPIENIRAVRHAWVTWTRLAKHAKAPRIIIESTSKPPSRILINAKIFKHEDMRYVMGLPTQCNRPQ